MQREGNTVGDNYREVCKSEKHPDHSRQNHTTSREIQSSALLLHPKRCVEKSSPSAVRPPAKVSLIRAAPGERLLVAVVGALGRTISGARNVIRPCKDQTMACQPEIIELVPRGVGHKGCRSVRRPAGGARRDGRVAVACWIRHAVAVRQS